MKKYVGFFVFASLVLSLGVSSLTYAKDDESSDDVDRPRLERTEIKELKDQRKTEREKLKDDRDLLKEKTQEEREALKEKFQEEREVLKEQIKTEREAFKTQLKTDRETFLAELKTKKEAWKNERSENKAKFCEKAKEAFSNKFTEAIAKLSGFQTRVSEVISKLKADGKDTAAAETALSISKTKLTEAEAKLASIKDVVPTTTCENMTGDVFAQIKLQAREAKDLLKESKNSLHDSIKELKTLRGLDSKDDDQTDDNGVDAVESNEASTITN